MKGEVTDAMSPSGCDGDDDEDEDDPAGGRRGSPASVRARLLDNEDIVRLKRGEYT